MRKYNDLKNLQDQEDTKSKMVILRRIAHKINGIREDLY